MKQLAGLAALAAVFIAIAVLGPRYLRQAPDPAAVVLPTPANCALSATPCEFAIDGYPIRVSLDRALVPLKPAQLTIESQAPFDTVRVDFEMLGMEMGDNHFLLKPTSPGVWSQTIILPVCSLGRSDWIAYIDWVLETPAGSRNYRVQLPLLTQNAY